MLTALAAASTLLLPAPVSALAADGPRVAVASGCEVRIWTPPAPRATLVGRHVCERTSTGSGIAAVSLAGDRALWLQYTGGNIREWTLWTSTPTQPVPRRVAFVARDVDEPSPIVLGEGDRSRLGDLLPYAVGRTVVALRSNGSRAFAWNAPGRVVTLAARDGEVAVGTVSAVTVLDSRGRVLNVVGSQTAIEAVRLTGSALVVQRGRTLELFGGQPALYTLVAGVQLADADGDRAALVGGGQVRTFDLATGRSRVVERGTLAALEGARLAIASGRSVSVR